METDFNRHIDSVILEQFFTVELLDCFILWLRGWFKENNLVYNSTQ